VSIAFHKKVLPVPPCPHTKNRPGEQESADSISISKMNRWSAFSCEIHKPSTHVIEGRSVMSTMKECNVSNLSNEVQSEDNHFLHV
jgi:hypothetical protein